MSDERGSPPADESTSQSANEEKRRVRVRLVDVETDEQIGRIIEGLQERDVWRNLDMKGPMDRPGKFRGQFLSGYYRAHFIVDADTDEEYGFFLLHCGRWKSAGRVEVDIALPNKNVRGKGISQLALVALFDHWLSGGLCKEMWGWIDAGNTASVQMVRSLEIPVFNQTRRAISVDGIVDVIEVHMTAEHWQRVRPKLQERWGL